MNHLRIANFGARSLQTPSKKLQVGNEWMRSVSSTSDDYQYLQKSKVPMLHFQPSLPRLKIPPLDKTCERYLNAQKPLLSDLQFQKTAAIVKQFQENEGKDLNNDLVNNDKQNKHTSYISAPWFDMYLKLRDPVVINVNPFMGFADDPKPGYNDQLIRSSNILISSLKFLRSLRENFLEPEVYHLNPSKSDNETFRRVMRLIPSSLSWYGAFLYKAFPLDMSQYRKLFNSTRIPRHGRDELLQDESATHMIVLRNGHFYSFDVLDNHGYIKNSAYIHGCLKHILSDTRPKVEHPLAALTTLDRDSWATLREHVINAGNGETLRLIDTAIFAISLDDDIIDEDPQKICHTMLHGDGYNRWFDKSFHLNITKDGKVALNFEHSWGDGVAVLRYMNEIFKNSTTKPVISPDSVPDSSAASNVKRLEICYNETIKEGIKGALERLHTTSKSLKFSIMQQDKFGKNFLKKQKVSPDAIMQLAFQMGYYKLTGKTVATYESCSTAAFRHGRTETIRPATTVTKKCSEAFAHRDSHSSAELRNLVEECSKVHGQLTKDAAMGNGFDRHLFAMRIIAEAKDPSRIPAIFTDDAYKQINHNILSTSTLSSAALQIAAFGPVVPNGFGLGYGIMDDSLGCVVSSYPTASDADSFVECVQTSLESIHDVLQKSSKP